MFEGYGITVTVGSGTDLEQNTDHSYAVHCYQYTAFIPAGICV